MRNGSEVSFVDLYRVCRHYFGEPRVNGSHHVFKTPWAMDPRVNIQNDSGKSKRYQVRQVVQAIDKLIEIALAKAKAKAAKEAKKDEKKKK